MNGFLYSGAGLGRGSIGLLGSKSLYDVGLERSYFDNEEDQLIKVVKSMKVTDR